MRKIIMVKKLLANGEPCPKCVQAQELLERRGLWDQIDEVIWAKEGDPSSPGAQMAERLEVDLAPFFVVEEPGATDRVYTSTLRLISDLTAPRESGRAPVHSPASRSDVVELSGSEPAQLPSTAAPAPGTAEAPVLSPEELRELAAQLGSARPEVILEWGLARFGAGCGIAFSGAEDVVLIDLAAKSGRAFSVFCLDT